MNEQPAGWYPDPDSHASVRYWNGERWTGAPAPAPTPAPAPAPGPSTRRIAVGVAWGVGAVIAALWAINAMSQPSPTECAEQLGEVMVGDRVAVDPDCD